MAKPRLLIDDSTPKESYKGGELNRIEWIPGSENTADVSTNEIISRKSAMCCLLNSSLLQIETIGWIRREKWNNSVPQLGSGDVYHCFRFEVSFWALRVVVFRNSKFS